MHGKELNSQDPLWPSGSYNPSTWQPETAPSLWALLCPTGYAYGMPIIVDSVGEGPTCVGS